jgi:hypothetical protein
MSTRKHAANAYESGLDGSIGSGDSTITLDSVVGLTATGILVIDPDSATLREVVSFTGISVNNLTGVSRGLTGSASGAQGHNSGIKIRSSFFEQYLDDIFTDIEALEAIDPLLKTGGTMTGKIVLDADPTSALHAATKQYSDLKLLLAGGVMTGKITLDADPTAALHAATKQYADGFLDQTEGDARYVELAGDIMTGLLTLSGDPDAALKAATKQYVDTVQTNVDALGTWQAWSPTYVNLTIGNGTVVARYTRIGDTVHAFFELTFGSTTAITGATPTISTPVAAATHYSDNANAIGEAGLLDIGATGYVGSVGIKTVNQFEPLAADVAGAHAAAVGLSATVPFTWTTGDVLQFTAKYEAA